MEQNLRGHYLILGGARSGKSALAEKTALTLSGHPAYIATAQAFDDEMRARIARHRSDRGERFQTFEEPLDLVGALEGVSARHDAVLVDCLTLWTSNLMAADRDVEAATDELAGWLSAHPDMPVIMVSNEVGLGIVPDNEMARQFRDHAGRAHQKLGAICPHVIFVTAGLPLIMKGALPARASGPEPS